MDIATWNVNSIRARWDSVARWLAEASPDVVCFQETKVVDDLFPRKELTEAGYPHVALWGQKTYNGVAIVSRHPIDDVWSGLTATPDDPQARIVHGRVQGVHIVNLYVPNGSRVSSPKFRYKLAWLRHLRAELDQRFTPESPLLVCADWNIAPDDQDVYDPFASEGELLFHPQERRSLQRILRFGLVDVLRSLRPHSSEFTWWDFRGGGFRKNHGFRIDYHLLTPSLAERCTDVITWRDVRGWEKPSDHVPVAARLTD